MLKDGVESTLTVSLLMICLDDHGNDDNEDKDGNDDGPGDDENLQGRDLHR